jgi:uncharacterized protein YndB with AHSA1/START domain
VSVVAKVQAAAARRIAAPADRVYRCLADYRQHHPQILPPNFTDYGVDEGGVGAGTLVHFRFRAGRREREYRMRVVEPEPGRTLVEQDQGSSLATTFTVLPDGDGCRVRIASEWEGAGGIGGFFERTFAPRVLRRVYADELERLERYAQAHPEA